MAAGEGPKEGGGGRGEYDRSIEHHLKVVRRLIVLLNELLLLYMIFSDEIATVHIRAQKKRDLDTHPNLQSAAIGTLSLKHDWLRKLESVP